MEKWQASCQWALKSSLLSNALIASCQIVPFSAHTHGTGSLDCWGRTGAAVDSCAQISAKCCCSKYHKTSQGLGLCMSVPQIRVPITKAMVFRAGLCGSGLILDGFMGMGFLLCDWYPCEERRCTTSLSCDVIEGYPQNTLNVPCSWLPNTFGVCVGGTQCFISPSLQKWHLGVFSKVFMGSFKLCQSVQVQRPHMPTTTTELSSLLLPFSAALGPALTQHFNQLIYACNSFL